MGRKISSNSVNSVFMFFSIVCLDIHKKWVHAERSLAIRAVEEKDWVSVTALAAFESPMLDLVGGGGGNCNQLPAAGWPGGDGTGREVFGNDRALGGGDEWTKREIFDFVKLHPTRGEAECQLSGFGVKREMGNTSEETDGLALPSLHIPDSKGMVATPRDNALSIGAQDERVDPACMPLENLEASTSLHIPDAERIVPTPRNNAAPIGAQDEGVDGEYMPLEHLKALASLHIPDAKRVVVTPRNNAPPIRAQDEGVD
jgi:hypothetical protein